MIPITLLVSLAAVPAVAQELPDHSAFTAVLGHHIRGPLVDYAALQRDRDALDDYLVTLGRADSAALAAAPRYERLAFWINAYNACALRLVIDHYPIRKVGFPASLVRSLQGVPTNSIRQISDTWKQEFCEVAGKARALDQIEHEILRPMGEARIHFAVNCASRSCPVLAPEAYSGALLEEQLDAAVRRFMAIPEHYDLEAGDQPVLRLTRSSTGTRTISVGPTALCGSSRPMLVPTRPRSSRAVSSMWNTLTAIGR
jgi:hypothetical protein